MIIYPGSDQAKKLTRANKRTIRSNALIADLKEWDLITFSMDRAVSGVLQK
jgi:hypothetical protein